MLLALLVIQESVAFQGLMYSHRSLLGSSYGSPQAAASGTAMNRLAGQTALAGNEGHAEATGLAYELSTVPVLKGMLRSRGLPVSGIKAVLVSRLEADDVTRTTRSAPGSTESGNEDSLDSLKSLDAFYDSLDVQQISAKADGRDTPDGDDSEDTDVPKVYTSRPDWCTRGDKISVTVNRYGPLGATVDIRMRDDAEEGAFRGQGLILQDEVTLLCLIVVLLCVSVQVPLTDPITATPAHPGELLRAAA